MALPKAEKERRREILENLKAQGFIPIIGCENYWIAKSGQIYSARTNRMMAQQINNTYLGLTLTRFGQVRRFNLHRLLLEHFGDKPYAETKDLITRHLNGNPLDNRLENLAWGTKKDNYEDAVRHGTNTRGELMGTSKLTEEAVREIRASDEWPRFLAKKFGVDKSLIWLMRTRKIWKHVA